MHQLLSHVYSTALLIFPATCQSCLTPGDCLRNLHISEYVSQKVFICKPRRNSVGWGCSGPCDSEGQSRRVRCGWIHRFTMSSEHLLHTHSKCAHRVCVCVSNLALLPFVYCSHSSLPQTGPEKVALVSSSPFSFHLIILQKLKPFQPSNLKGPCIFTQMQELIDNPTRTCRDQDKGGLEQKEGTRWRKSTRYLRVQETCKVLYSGKYTQRQK